MNKYKLRFFYSFEVGEDTYNPETDTIYEENLIHDIEKWTGLENILKVEVDTIWQDAYLYWIVESFVEVIVEASNDIQELYDTVMDKLSSFNTSTNAFTVYDMENKEIFNNETKWD